MTEITWTAEAAEKGGFEHFMLKEIHEQPQALRQCLAGRVAADGTLRVDELAPARRTSCAAITRVELVACGTASYASLVGAALIERWTGLPARVTVGSEFRYSPPPLDRHDPRHRGHPVGRDGRHDRPDPPRARAGLPDRRRDEHRRLGDHPRGRRGPLPAGRPGDRGGGLEDLHDPGGDARHGRRRDRPGARARLPRRRSASSSPPCAPSPMRPSGRSTRTPGSATSPGAT